MTPTPYYFDTLYRSTKAEWDTFVRWTDFLPRRIEGEPYHSGPHSLQRFRSVYELLRPKRVLEIGFNLGHSAVMWVELGVGQVVTVQPECGVNTMKALEAISIRYKAHQIHMMHDDSRSIIEKKMIPEWLAPGTFDLISIDGSHERAWVESDIALGKALRCPYFLMDDYDSHHGPGVVDAVQSAGLIPMAIFGTMCLCRAPDLFTQRSDPLGRNYYE